MPMEVTFKLSDSDLDHLQALMLRARDAAGSVADAKIIEAALAQRLEQARGSELPDFISERLGGLDALVLMLSDEEWQLPDAERERVLAALAYFVDPEDLIADRIPGFGFLDDAIVAELVVRDLQHEIDAYNEFSAYRKAEEKRRANLGQSIHVGREDWLADKRAVLHHRMRDRRRRQTTTGWRLTTW